MSDSSDVFIGVDIGGTKVAAGLISANGEILHSTRTAMNTRGTAEEGLQSVRDAIDALLRESRAAEAKGIGLSSPGPVDPHTGVVINPGNLPCWRNYPLASAVEKFYGLPTILHHDSDTAGLAEALWGAGVGFSQVFYATVGTGIGTAVIVDGRAYLGRTGAAGEGGHMTIDYKGKKCRCGKQGCVEILAAGPAIAARAQHKIVDDPSRGQRLLELVEGNLTNVTGHEVGIAWREGDPLATEVLQETADVLAVWFGNMIDLLEPDVIVMGGGVSPLLSGWFEHIRSRFAKWSVNKRAGEIPLLPAKYGIDSGMVGAAALCLPSVKATSEIKLHGASAK